MTRGGARELMQEHIRNVMSHEMVTASADDSLVDVTRQIAAHRVDAALVVDPNQRLIGIVSTSDVVNLLHDGGHLGDKCARDVMSPSPISIDEFAPVDEAIGVMRNAGIRHLPVSRGGRLIGLVTASEIVRHLLASYPDPDAA
jgi:CBS domain-containing protein